MFHFELSAPDEDGLKSPIVPYWSGNLYSLTWNCMAWIHMLEKSREMIMPGEDAEIIVATYRPMFVEPQQRITFRALGKTVATGVVTKILPSYTEAEKDAFKKDKRTAAKEVIERLGYDPYLQVKVHG